MLSRECSLGAHGLLRFRTNDVLLGTSGVGVCVSVVSNSLGMLYRVRMATSLSPAAISCWISFRKRKVASSKPAGPLYYFFSPERAQFCSRCLLDSIQRSQAVAWCVFRFRHGRSTESQDSITQPQVCSPSSQTPHTEVFQNVSPQKNLRYL